MRRAATLGVVLLLGITPGAGAQPFGRAGAKVLEGCVPAYAVMEPDTSYGATSLFRVIVREPNRVIRWAGEFVFTNKLCCEQTRAAVASVLAHVTDKAATVEVDDGCY